MKGSMINEEFRKKQPEPQVAGPINFRPDQFFQLGNGLKIILVENHKLPRINVQLYIDRGVFADGDKVGLQELAGQMLSCGTLKDNKSEWDRKLDYYGGSISTTSIGGSASALTKYFNPVFELFADAFLHPAFPANEFDNLQRQLLSNLAAQKSEPEAIFGNLIKRKIYPDTHPYREVITETSVRNITVEDCRNWFISNSSPDISYLIFEGDITLEKIKSLLKDNFESWEQKKVHTVEWPTEVNRGGVDVSFVERPGAVQSLIGIGYSINYLPYIQDTIAANLMNSVLGGYFSSRLNLNLRENKGYTYGIYSRLSNDESLGSFSTSVSVRNDVTADAIREIIKEMVTLRNVDIDADELQQVKNVISGNFSRSVENPLVIAKYAFARHKFLLPEDYFKNQLIRINAVSGDDISQMAQKYLLTDDLHIMVIGNRDVIDSLAEFGQVSEYDFEGNLIG